MVRAALTNKRRIGQGPRSGAAYIPAASVIGASFLSALPIVSGTGWWPDFAFLILIAWRLLRSDVWPAWWAAPLGFVNDVVSGLPIGFSVALWTASMLALDIADRRTMWRDYWIEWALAALLILAHEAFEWKVAEWMGALLPFSSIVPALLIAVVSFPIAAWLVSRLDHWRLGR